jgi:hypothetical protein
MDFQLDPGETVTVSVRKHWFVLFKQLLPYLVLGLIPLWVPDILAWATQTHPESFASVNSIISIDNPWTRLLLGIWWLVLWVGAFNEFTSYYLNQWIITTQRIITVQQHGYFSREIAHVLLTHVQDVSTNVEGFFATLLGYGTLEVESAGAEEKFIMPEIQRPAHLRDVIVREIADVHGMSQPPA